MTGKLYFDGGTSDIMAGGSGANDYMFGAIGDSTPPVMDVITNFKVSGDTIDLSGIELKLQAPTVLSSTSNTPGADSIGINNLDGNTYVVVNSSSHTNRRKD